MAAPIDSELSRPLRLGDVPVGGKTVTLEAGAVERAALAKRLGVVSLDRLTASLTIQRDDRGRQFRVHGQFDAALTQICVVTLEPFATMVSDAVVARFDRAAARPSRAITRDSAGRNVAADQSDMAAIDILVMAGDVLDDEVVEPVYGETIDLGELVAQYLSLAIDPHPRRPNARFDPGVIGPEDDRSKTRSPFAALSSMRGD